jgi:hypothetical protein
MSDDRSESRKHLVGSIGKGFMALYSGGINVQYQRIINSGEIALQQDTVDLLHITMLFYEFLFCAFYSEISHASWDKSFV